MYLNILHEMLRIFLHTFMSENVDVIKYSSSRLITKENVAGIYGRAEMENKRAAGIEC